MGFNSVFKGLMFFLNAEISGSDSWYQMAE